jgi:hypothetical protein
VQSLVVRAAALVTLAVPLSSIAAARNDGNAIVRTTLCAVVQKPADFDGKRVRFAAAFESDGLDNSVLMSRRCKLGIVPYYADTHQNVSELAALDAALARGMAGTLDKSIQAVFVGIFEYQPHGRYQRILRIERVMFLSVLPKRDARSRR